MTWLLLSSCAICSYNSLPVAFFFPPHVLSCSVSGQLPLSILIPLLFMVTPTLIQKYHMVRYVTMFCLMLHWFIQCPACGNKQTVTVFTAVFHHSHTKANRQFEISSHYTIGLWHGVPVSGQQSPPGQDWALFSFVTITYCHFMCTLGETYPTNCHHSAQITLATFSNLSVCGWVPAVVVVTWPGATQSLPGRLPQQAGPTPLRHLS